MPFSLTPLDAAALDRIFQEERSRSPSARTRFRFSGTGGECCSPRGSFFLRNLNYIKLLSSLFLYAPPGGTVAGKTMSVFPLLSILLIKARWGEGWGARGEGNTPCAPAKGVSFPPEQLRITNSNA